MDSQAIWQLNVMLAAKRMGASPSDIPGLWNVPEYPELTTAQLLECGLGATDGKETTMRLSPDDFPVQALGNRVYGRTRSSPIATCADGEMAAEVAFRLNASDIHDAGPAIGAGVASPGRRGTNAEQNA